MSPPAAAPLLARGPSAEVARCSCGHIHLSLGPVTIRLDAETLHAAWHTMGDALQALADERRETAESAAAPSGWKQ